MLDCPTSPSAEMVDCLRSVDAQELVRATKDLNCTVSNDNLLINSDFEGPFIHMLDSQILKLVPYDQMVPFIGKN